MLDSQRSHYHFKTNLGVIDSSEGVGRKGQMSSTTDRHRAGILDGQGVWQIKRLRLSPWVMDLTKKGGKWEQVM